MLAQTHDELVEALKEQAEALEHSSTAFDQGVDWESKRLATTIRILLHDTIQSKSLLGQLNSKDLNYYTTPHRAEPDNLLKGSFLFRQRLYRDEAGNSGLKYMPRLDDLPPNLAWTTLPFEEWWNEQVLFDSKGEVFTRRQLVLDLADKDGGTHVDPNLSQRYADLSRNNSIGWNVMTEHGEKFPDDRPERVCVRQIAFELLKTLREQLSMLKS